MTAIVDGPGRTDDERHGRSVHLVGVLARAMTAQFDELARTGGPAPDGWWFADGATSSTTDEGTR